MLAALDCVDAVALFDEDTPADIIRAIQPDVLVKGADWPADQIVGRDTVEARGGRVVRVAGRTGLLDDRDHRANKVRVSSCRSPLPLYQAAQSRIAEGGLGRPRPALRRRPLRAANRLLCPVRASPIRPRATFWPCQDTHSHDYDCLQHAHSTSGP